MDEFDLKARQQFSDWVWKPSQERGTLPSLPVTKSLIERDIRSNSKLRTVTDSQRHELVEHLYRILDEEYQLATVADYSRRAGPVPAEDGPGPTRSSSEDPRPKDYLTKPTKRSFDLSSKGMKRQQTLDSHFPRTSPQQVNASFETNLSAAVSDVFSVACEDGVGGSNDTSMISEEEFHPSFTTSVECIFCRSPFEQYAELPPETPFWLAWDIHRLAHQSGIEPVDLHSQMLAAIGRTGPSADDFCSTLRGLTVNSGEISPESELPDWVTSKNEYYNKESHKAVSLRVNLRWSGNLTKGRFEYQLSPIHLDQSCRLQRRFGADRLLVLSILVPANYASSQQTHRPHCRSMKDCICDWLTASGHLIAGRYWRVFFSEQGSSTKLEGKLEGKQERMQEFKVFLFAETGFDMVPRPVWSTLPLGPTKHKILLEELVQWHIPPQPNQASKNYKHFSRCGLALSKTTPTIALQRAEFIRIDDALGDPMAHGRQEVMNDGCSLMSLAYAKEVWKCWGGIGEVPSAVQGRISGAKGLWIVDFRNSHPEVSPRDFWIEISPSQLKIKPHPSERDADETQRTFEVLKWVKVAKEGALNKQLVAILVDRGVNRDVLKAALIADLSEITDSLFSAMDDPVAMRAWVQKQSLASRIGATKMIGCFPADKRDQANMLLDAGFKPQNCAMLVKLAKAMLIDYLTRYVEKLRIKIPHSTMAFCAVDPIGLLEPGQIHLSFSHPRIHPMSGLSENQLDEIDVLVTRNPAYLASDIQLVRAVYKPELRHYKDLAVFPRKGQKPLASLLSGGDYDGDTVTIIWDPSIVKEFKNASMPQLPTEEECGLVNRSRPLSEFFHDDLPRAHEVRTFIRSCLNFNLSQSLMGLCSDEHGKLSYALSLEGATLGLSDPGLIKLAAAAGYLVDASKQGWEPNTENWVANLSKAKGRRKLDAPAHKSSLKGKCGCNGQQKNVIDYLKFDVATGEKDGILKAFEERFAGTSTYDHDLSSRWKYWKNLADGSLKRLLFDETNEKSLVKQVRVVRTMWTTMWAKERGNRCEDLPSTGRSSAAFASIVATTFDAFKAIKPERVDHEFYRQYEREAGRRFSEWSLLRSSCLYNVLCNGAPNRHQSLLWHIAGRELCHLKANEQPDTLDVVPQMYPNLRFDSKRHKRLMEEQSYGMGTRDVAFNMDGDEESYDDDDDEE
ncbi:uncharacterized protein A1O9_01632 [Exophiala aquamarina CBS 119918]|uniref:RNA-dependent RNA polymerase n=1 Tax=Exophiala aquamarina CBS 119918 TaxID=1182545 RepID=A0A072PU74_9EURO|nr:uncharacterized protein A1O9_01632 [Exophiala aquamarina CBS 119918]KEF63654.1 hypothetical protein A1O9_01632 [Exophiala aquamarina CBS 119918]